MCTMAMDALAATNPLAEAGSREAPALPPGLLTDIGETPEEMHREAMHFMGPKGEVCRPTKLFIGGISRHTTTKQLRDHFAQFSRVLDCVAMRQPDGRPRGFGYVTLDSPSAAERCLREPQMIDSRIVDMKAAVPEGTGSQCTSPKEAGFMNMFAGQDYNMGMYAGQGWPEAAGPYGPGMPWWTSAKTSPHGSQGLDCLDLLSAARELAMSGTSSPHGLPLHAMGLQDYAELSHDPLDGMGLLLPPHLADEPRSTLIPAEFQQAAGGKMSASAPEFVPFGSKAPTQPVCEAKVAPAKLAPAVAATPPSKDLKVVRARAPLGELTNIVEAAQVEDLLKPFKSPSGKFADIGQGHLGAIDGAADRRFRPTGLLLDDDVVNGSSPSSGSADEWTSPDTTPERVAAVVESSAEEDTPEPNERLCDKLEDAQGPVSPVSSSLSDDDDDSESGRSEMEAVIVDMDDLPSIGSAQHATGECKRCNFYPKGRCQNGKNCSFCHYSHDKRKPSRQEKRERRAAWLEHQDQDGEEGMCCQAGPLLSEMRAAEVVAVQPVGPLLFSQPIIQQGLFPVYQDEDVYNDETLAYSIFPGLPPIHMATKLPAPLPLPGMDMTCQTGPALPPGLGLGQPAWQSEVVPTRSTPVSAAFLGTVPTPLATPASSVASTPLPTPMATPTAAAMALSAEARSFAVGPSTQTFGTQTGDYRCNKCIVAEVKTEQEADNGAAWSREALLRLRDGILKMPGATEISGGILFTRSTAAIASSAGN